MFSGRNASNFCANFAAVCVALRLNASSYDSSCNCCNSCWTPVGVSLSLSPCNSLIAFCCFVCSSCCATNRISCVVLPSSVELQSYLSLKPVWSERQAIVCCDDSIANLAKLSQNFSVIEVTLLSILLFVLCDIYINIYHFFCDSITNKSNYRNTCRL